jgi:ferric-dicitrate binding protein FerR (iron transport regulator)
MTNANNDSVNELITKHLVGEASADEQQQLFSWIADKQENERHYLAMKKAFDLTDQHFAVPAADELPIDIEHEWNHFTDSIGQQKTSTHLSSAQLWLRIAASVLLLMVVGGVLYYYSSPDQAIYQTAATKQTVVLPDGSEVTLNRYTTLSVDAGFAKENRSVTLKGEAFFNVQPDADKPFVILTKNATVQVVGTSFNVNAYDSLQEVEVIVTTGIVLLETKGGKEKVRLVPGQKGIYSETTEKIVSAVNQDVNFLSWNTGRLVFVENDLRSVLETLKKTYHSDIVIRTDIPVSCIVTVTFDQQSLESVLKVLESTLNLKYVINGNAVEITEAGC